MGLTGTPSAVARTYVLFPSTSLRFVSGISISEGADESLESFSGSGLDEEDESHVGSIGSYSRLPKGCYEL